MASIRNTVVVAIMQAGIIVIGVLAAGICHKVWLANNLGMPLPAAVLYNYGLIGFLIPMAWGTGAVIVQLRANISDDIKVLSFWLGVLFLIMLAGFIAYADVSPWIHAMVLTPAGSGGDNE